MLDDNILFEESICDTTSKNSDKVILDRGEGFLKPAFPAEKQSIELPSPEDEYTLDSLSSALVPRPTEGATALSWWT